jgi:hypothetical protein
MVFCSVQPVTSGITPRVTKEHELACLQRVTACDESFPSL